MHGINYGASSKKVKQFLKHLKVITFILNHKKPVTTVDIANLLDCSNTVAYNLLFGLLDNDLVKREQVKRINYFEPTDKLKQLIKEVHYAEQ